MVLHELMLGIHFVGLLFSFFAVYTIAKSENKEKANYMVVTIVCNIISIAGYIFELMSTDLSAMLVAVKMQYLGKAFVGTFLLFTFVRYYKWKFPKAVMRLFWFIDIAMYFVIITLDKHEIYYTNMRTETVNGHQFLVVGRAPLYVAFMVYMLGTLLLFSFICYRNWKDAKGRAKKILGKLAVSSVVADIAILLSILNFTYPYDMVPLIIAIFSIVISVFIQRYGLFATLDIAKENLITSIDEGVIVRDADGVFQYANPRAYDMFPELESVGVTVVDKNIDSILAGRDSDIAMFRGRYYQVKLRTLYDEKQEAGQMITFFDVTELRESNKKMEQLKIEADNANQAKSSFLANMSHEIRTPINAVLGMDEMILRETSEEHVREYATNIKRAGETLLYLVSDILDLSKIESGKMVIINERYNTKDAISDVINTFTIRMRQKGLNFITEADRNIPRSLVGDEVRIKQIVMNLLSNAFKYTEEGYVKFKVSGEQKENVYNLTIAIEDTGIGIKEEDISKLFESFKRVDEKKNRHIEGSGLGLNITRNLLNMMGSDIKVESVYGKGSTFSFTVSQEIADGTPMGDILSDKGKADIHEDGRAGFTVPDGRILVVDDNAVNLAVVKGLLKKTKVQVDTVLSGEECLQKIKENKYHLIFMDHLMPEMDGVETLQKMRETDAHLNSDTAVIILTANAIAGARETYMAAGFDDYMIKPVDAHVLESIILKFMPKELIKY